MMTIDDQFKRSLRIAVAATAISITGLVLLWAVVVQESRAEHVAPNWSIFGVITVLLLGCERLPATWIRSGPIGTVTPLWMFAYALLLLGSSSLGIAVALLGATVHALSQAESVTGVIARVAGVSISLSAASLVLGLLGVNGPITQFERVPWDWALAIVVAGITIIVLNALVAAITLSARRRVSFVTLLRRGLAVRVTAEGALLSLAPIWVLGINFSLVLIPLLGITTVLVFRSTRQALEQSHQAHHDPLTGLLNRRAFLDHLDDSLADVRAPVRSTLLIMDLNGFKDINDRLGHQLGDVLLVAFADRLEKHRPADSVTARLGGDEFAVLLIGTATNVAIADLVTELHDRLSEPLELEGFPVTVGVSIGVATCPDHGHTPRDLLRAADVAMYRAKRTGTAVERYDKSSGGQQRGRLNLLSDLGEALKRDELFVHFQPQIRMSDGSIDTVEALVRWNHREHGSISPAEFVGLAEQTDLIAPITEMVLRVATIGLRVAASTDVKLAVNVSPRSLQDPYFASEVFRILDETGFPADRLELEVTERAIVNNVERSTYTIDQLRNAGIRIAIDDFGVGYSSYETLRTLQVDRVKIDRDFVQGLLTQPRDRMIVASLIRLAHDLGLDVVAEGVESTPLWDALSRLGCDVAQGYGIAVPMAYPELRGWLESWNRAVDQQIAEQLAEQRG